MAPGDPAHVPLLSLDRCPLCGGPLGPEAFGTTYTDLWENRDCHRYAYHPCPACEVLILANPPVPGPALGAFYAHRGGCSFLDWRHPHPLVRRYTRSLQRAKLDLLTRVVSITPTERVLEVGCGKGAFAAALREEVGCDVHASDLDPDLASHMPAGVTYHAGPFETLSVPDTRFDVVVSHQVVEHVYDPRAFLQAGYALLKPGGVMVVETINTASASFRLFRDNWSQLCAPRHTVLYSDRFFLDHLATLLPGATVEVRYEGYAARFGTWAASTIHALHLPMATSKAAHLLAGVIYMATNPWCSWLERRIGKERAIITVVVRKPL